MLTETTPAAGGGGVERRFRHRGAILFRWPPGELLHQLGGLLQVSPSRHICSKGLADSVEFVQDFLANLQGVGIRSGSLLGLGLTKQAAAALAGDHCLRRAGPLPPPLVPLLCVLAVLRFIQR